MRQFNYKNCKKKCQIFINKKGVKMKAYVMGNYTDKAFQGFMKDPTSDRKAVVEQLVKAVGGKIHSCGTIWIYNGS